MHKALSFVHADTLDNMHAPFFFIFMAVTTLAFLQGDPVGRPETGKRSAPVALSVEKFWKESRENLFQEVVSGRRRPGEAGKDSFMDTKINIFIMCQKRKQTCPG